MCFAIGGGERQLDKALVEGKHSLKPLWKHEQVLHRAQIAQFTAASLSLLHPCPLSLFERLRMVNDRSSAIAAASPAIGTSRR